MPDTEKKENGRIHLVEEVECLVKETQTKGTKEEKGLQISMGNLFLIVFH